MRDVLVFRLCRERSAERLVMSEPAVVRPEFPSREGTKGCVTKLPSKKRGPRRELSRTMEGCVCYENKLPSNTQRTCTETEKKQHQIRNKTVAIFENQENDGI